MHSTTSGMVEHVLTVLWADKETVTDVPPHECLLCF